MVYKSSNASPSLEEIDLSQNGGNTFEAQVNTSGEPIKSYKMSILFSE